MAEFVQQSIEEMLPELEQMERVGLFTSPETRTILRKRRNYEYKLRRRTKQKEDYLNYIQYEINLLSLIKKRRERLGYNFKREEIDVAIVQRVHKLFKLAIFRFQDDIKLWLSHIEFCKTRNEKASVSRMFTRMLQIHNKKPKLWLMAAKWEMEESKAVENARNLLQRALRFNPKSKQLWLEYFRMELMNAEKMRKRKEIMGLADMENDDEMSDEVLEGQIAHIVYRQAMDTFTDDADLNISFLKVAQLFDFTEEFQSKILNDVKDHHGDKEVTWDGIARNHLINSNVGDEERIAAICQLYDRAVVKLPTESMWTYYLKYCLEQCQVKLKKKMLGKRIEQTLAVFDKAHTNGCVTESMFLEWVTLLLTNGKIDKLKEVVSAATTTHPQSIRLWRERLALAFKTNDDQEVYRLIKEALTTVADQVAWPLWQMALDWCREALPDQMEKLLEMGLVRGAEVCAPVKCCYIQWAAEKHNLHKVRQLYKRFSTCQPLSVEFFQQYIHIEKEKENFKMKHVRKAFEDAICEFGSTDIDIWLDYIQQEMTSQQGQPENVGTLHWRAVKALDGSLTQAFLDKYTLLQTGHLTQETYEL